MALKRFLFFGSDPELSGKLLGLLKKNTDDNFELVTTTDVKEFLLAIKTKIFHLVLIDYTHENTQPMDLGGQVRTIKRNQALARIPFVAITAEEKSFRELQELILQGHCYVYIKGADILNLALDCCLIAFESVDRELPQYARARKIGYPMKAISSGVVTSLGRDGVIFDSDLIFDEGDAFPAKFNFYQEFNDSSFMLSKVNHINSQFNLLKNYLCPIPFKGPWDVPTEIKVDKDSYQTWFDLHLETCPLELSKVFIFDQRLDRLDDQYALYSRATSACWFFSTIDEHLILIMEQRPDIIAVNISVEEESKINFESMQVLLNQVLKQKEYLPLVFVYSSTSSSMALRQAYGYDQMIALEENFSSGHFTKYLELFEKKRQSTKKVDQGLRPDYKSNEALINIELKIELTTLTEHEFTFLHEGDLPLYTTLLVKLPCPLLLLVVPPPVGLASSNKGTHYYALINAVSEEKLEFLRTFVYKAINDSKQAFIDLLAPPKPPPAPVVVAPKKENPLVKSAPVKNAEEKSEDIFNVKRKSPYKGPSKL